AEWIPCKTKLRSKIRIRLADWQPMPGGRSELVEQGVIAGARKKYRRNPRIRRRTWNPSEIAVDPTGVAHVMQSESERQVRTESKRIPNVALQTRVFLSAVRKTETGSLGRKALPITESGK